MNTCVSDDQAVVNIQGIRNVTWGELVYASSSHPGKKFHVTVMYKGSHTPLYYSTETSARSMFNKIREAMDKTFRQ